MTFLTVEVGIPNGKRQFFGGGIGQRSWPNVYDKCGTAVWM